MDTSIVIALIGAIGTTMATLLGRRHQGGTQIIITVGTGLTLIVLLVVFSSDALQKIEEQGQKIEQLPKEHTIADFPLSPVNIGREFEKSDELARALLEGAGPREWKISERRTLRVDEVVYADKWKWVEMVFPDSDQKRLRSEECRLAPKGKLEIRGFSPEQRSALVEYTAPDDDSGGTRCDTGTYFFYRLPRRH